MKVAQRYLQSEKQRKESERIKHLYKNNKTANLRSNGERETDAEREREREREREKERERCTSPLGSMGILV